MLVAGEREKIDFFEFQESYHKIQFDDQEIENRWRKAMEQAFADSNGGCCLP